MCYARRQRLSWARIKLSKKIFKFASLRTFFLSSLSFCSFTWISPATFVASETLFCSISTAEFSSISLCFRLSLFNFQSAVRCPFLALRCDSLAIISQLSSLVKGFFNFFLLFLLPCKSLSFWQPDYYITSFWGCQGGLQKFFRLFQADFAIQWSLPELPFISFAVPQTALLLYHQTSRLSTLFCSLLPFQQPNFDPFRLLCIFYTIFSPYLYITTLLRVSYTTTSHTFSSQ